MTSDSYKVWYICTYFEGHGPLTLIKPDKYEITSSAILLATVDKLKPQIEQRSSALGLTTPRWLCSGNFMLLPTQRNPCTVC
jgi:hypothetical protein